MKNTMKALVTIIAILAILFMLLSVTLDPLAKLFLVGIAIAAGVTVVIVLALKLSKIKK